LDVLVLATGFDAHRFFGKMEVRGEGGLDLDHAWSEANITYRAVTIPKFPNWFMLGGPTTPIGNFSYLMTMEHQLHYVMELVKLIASGDARVVAPKPEPTAAYNAALREKVKGSIWASGCRNWYLDKTGTPASYPWTYERFSREMSAPLLEDFEIA
jgi:cyclohexanone monooxygenase